MSLRSLLSPKDVERIVLQSLALFMSISVIGLAAGLLYMIGMQESMERDKDQAESRYFAALNRVRDIQDTLNLVTSAVDSSPLPQWIKDQDGVYRYVNPAYVNVYLHPQNKAKEDALGHTDFAIWPKFVAENFRRNDNFVLRTGRILDTMETIAIPGSGDQSEIRVVKYPRFLDRSEAIYGVAGFAIPETVSELIHESVIPK